VSLIGSKLLTLGNAAAIRTGQTFSMTAAGNVRIRSSGGSASARDGDMLVLDAPLAGSSARRVRAAVVTPLNGVYDPKSPGLFASTITGSVNGPLAVPRLGSLRVGDAILVANGTSASASSGLSPWAANGIYTVTQLGSSTSKWILTRSTTADTAGELPSNSYVTITEGNLAGYTCQLTYSGAFARVPLAVAGVQLTTNIGSNDPNDTVSFLVSRETGSNDSPGSLGKMMNLFGKNDTRAASTNRNQASRLGFTTDVNSISLIDELPILTRSTVIDGALRYTVDGTTVAAPAVFVDGSRIATNRLGQPVVAGSMISGIVLGGSGASGSTVANIGLTGFSRGPAITVESANSVLLETVRLGVRAGVRAANKIGVLVWGNSNGTTILNSTIAGNLDFGVAVSNAATRTTIVGSAIGLSGVDNGAGIASYSTGTVSIGLEPIPGVISIPVSLGSAAFVSDRP
jgi:hypothetical protein